MPIAQKIPFISILLASLTLLVSLYVSWAVNGTLLSTVRIVDLAHYGGVRFSDIAELKLWRFFTAQLVHVKWPHMLFNVACLFGIASLVEFRVGGFRALLLWMMSGGFATLISPILVEAPYNVGTGASHAVLAFAGCAILYAAREPSKNYWLKTMILICLLPAFLLDFVYAGYPKPGHITALILGAGFGWLFIRNPRSDLSS